MTLPRSHTWRVCPPGTSCPRGAGVSAGAKRPAATGSLSPPWCPRLHRLALFPDNSSISHRSKCYCLKKKNKEVSKQRNLIQGIQLKFRSMLLQQSLPHDRISLHLSSCFLSLRGGGSKETTQTSIHSEQLTTNTKRREQLYFLITLSLWELIQHCITNKFLWSFPSP